MLRVHFLNVGHGDCTIIEHGRGNITMIDINNGQELDDKTASELAYEFNRSPASVYNEGFSDNITPYEVLQKSGYNIPLSNPIEYFINRLQKGYNIFRYIQTHPDLDHMRGLSALRKAGIKITNFWDTGNEKEVEEFFFDKDKEDWAEYQRLRGDNSGVTVLKLKRNATGPFYNHHPEHLDDGDGLYILSPTKELTDEANRTKLHNNHSYVLRLVYKGIKVIFGGDAEQSVWDSIVEHYGSELDCHVLKASHHGRASGYHAEAIKLMKPEYTIVSVGKKPATDASSLYRQHCNNVWSTRWKGNVLLTINDDGTAEINSDYNN